MKSNYSYAQYLLKLLIHGRTLSLDRIEFKFIWAFFIKQCLQKTLTWFYSIRYTIDLHSNSPFVEILHPILYPLIFNIEILFSFESERQIWKKKQTNPNCGINCFHLGGVTHTLNAPWKLNQRKANNIKCLRILRLFFL